MYISLIHTHICVYIYMYSISHSQQPHGFSKKKNRDHHHYHYPPLVFSVDFFPIHRHLGQELASYVLTGATGGLGKLGKPNDGPMDDGGVGGFGVVFNAKGFLGVEKNKYPPGN